MAESRRSFEPPTTENSDKLILVKTPKTCLATSLCGFLITKTIKKVKASESNNSKQRLETIPNRSLYGLRLLKSIPDCQSTFRYHGSGRTCIHLTSLHIDESSSQDAFRILLTSSRRSQANAKPAVPTTTISQKAFVTIIPHSRASSHPS